MKLKELEEERDRIDKALTDMPSYDMRFNAFWSRKQLLEARISKIKEQPHEQ